jgi:hypothetical protein
VTKAGQQDPKCFHHKGRTHDGVEAKSIGQAATQGHRRRRAGAYHQPAQRLQKRRAAPLPSHRHDKGGGNDVTKAEQPIGRNQPPKMVGVAGAPRAAADDGYRRAQVGQAQEDG